ncbi:hypothetical protein GJ633_15810, partial [Halorubrum sp. CBA1125]|nr:hypothetical protein [Halorubrum sp. CBA1125]
MTTHRWATTEPLRETPTPPTRPMAAAIETAPRRGSRGATADVDYAERAAD